ncbi:Lrp/AsnC family transcriptional regulator [Salmonella enterica]|nr:Lrp/AsnC family transcriptional regulator [Salmonella enterica]EBG2984569.1 Lrp/AsnC family transcriptional regulator [Salmonella enterica subsp. enterica serovar Panama]EBL2028687.1 Lrp/AsnC family transcriptional regulator [Salmonella enterica]EBM0742197.1 Lrp/AsnC family transcriptional regulator [Salmonella enterica]EBS6263486.1 Lrp/AsnC family transcriptional regulator [Salmonella enterica subsp. enterica serovar Panama]
MTEYLDDKDKELLKEIQKDCAQTLWQLAYKVGLTPTPCFKRLKKLKDRGVIIGQFALLDKEKLGLSLNVFIMINISEGQCASISEEIKSMPEVIAFYRISGSFNYLMHTVFTDMNDYYSFYEKIILTNSSISGSASSFALEQIKETNELPV